jgi:tetratricopeptide (TPR) repeat protein
MRVANIALREKLWGGGYVGQVDVAQPAPVQSVGLSWAQERALGSIQQSTEATATASFVTAGAVASLERSLERMSAVLGMRMDQQTDVLADSLVTLAAIEETLRTPAKTRAAERVADVGVLLAQGRVARARPLAEEAVSLDPTNPHAFLAAGWVCIGDNDYEQARALFEEAMEAAQGDLRSRAARQAARLAYADGEADRALALIEQVSALDVAADEAIAVDYDRCLYEIACGKPEDATRRLRDLCLREPATVEMVRVDRAFADYSALLRTAEEAAADGPVLDAQQALHDAAQLAASCRQDVTRCLPLKHGWRSEQTGRGSSNAAERSKLRLRI